MRLSLPQLHHLRLSHSRARIQDQKGLRITTFFRMMAFTLVNIFSMIYVYNFGFSVFSPESSVRGIIFVMGYLIILEFTILLSSIPLATYFLNRIGYRRSLITSLGFSATGFIFLALSSWLNSLLALALAPVFLGLGAAAYWITYHVLFVEDVELTQLGSSFGVLEAIMRFGQVSAPLIGAGITVLFGFEILFLSGIFLLLVSGLPMLFLKHHLHFDQVSFKEFFAWSREIKFLRFGLAAGGRAVEERLLAGVWPLYVFLVVGSVEGLGVFQATVLLFTAIFGVIVAKLFDRKSKRIFQAIGVLGGATFWLIRINLTSLTSLIVVDSVDKFFTTTARIFFFGYAFRRARGRQTLSFVVYWYMWEAFWLVLAYSVLIILLLVFGLGPFWFLVALTAALGMLATLLVEEHK